MSEPRWNSLHWRADPSPLQQEIDTIVAKDPEAVPDLADRMALPRTLPARSGLRLDRALAAHPAAGYSNEGFVFPRSWCEGARRTVAGRSKSRPSPHSPPRAPRSRRRCETSRITENRFALLGMIDAALGSKEEAIREGGRG